MAPRPPPHAPLRTRGTEVAPRKLSGGSSCLATPGCTVVRTVDQCKKHAAALKLGLADVANVGQAAATCWSRKERVHVKEQHIWVALHECYDFAEATAKCEAAPDCSAIAQQADV